MLSRGEGMSIFRIIVALIRAVASTEPRPLPMLQRAAWNQGGCSPPRGLAKSARGSLRLRNSREGL
jgi:hypothetical protein